MGKRLSKGTYEALERALGMALTQMDAAAKSLPDVRWSRCALRVPGAQRVAVR